MKSLILIGLMSFASQLMANLQDREGSVLVDKETASILYFTCSTKDITGACDSYKAYLERPFPDDVVTILPVPEPREKVLLHNSLYVSLLKAKDIYITSEPINYKTYEATKWFYDKTNKDEFSFGNILVKAIASPATLVVAIGETLWEKPQNFAKSIKSFVLKAKFKKPLKRLFAGKKTKVYTIRHKKFDKLVKLIQNIR